MFVTIIVNNDKVINEKKHYEILIKEKYFIFNTSFNFNLMNTVKNYLYYNADNHLKL